METIQTISQRLSSESRITGTPSQQDLVLARLLDLAASVTTGKELTPGEAEFWKQELHGYSEKAIDWAFREHLRRSRYFPTLAGILELIREFRAQACSYTGPVETDEDRRRKAAGWRQYGVPDTKCYAKLSSDQRAKLGRRLTENEIEGLLSDVDWRIDSLGKSKGAGQQ